MAGAAEPRSPSHQDRLPPSAPPPTPLQQLIGQHWANRLPPWIFELRCQFWSNSFLEPVVLSQHSALSVLHPYPALTPDLFLE